MAFQQCQYNLFSSSDERLDLIKTAYSCYLEMQFQWLDGSWSIPAHKCRG